MGMVNQIKGFRLTGFIIIALSLHACNGGTDTTAQANNGDDAAKVFKLVDNDAAKFAAEAAGGSLTEVEMGKLAIKKALDKRVKNLGAMMVKDHLKAENNLQQLAKEKKIPLPQTLGAADQQQLYRLERDSGKNFDRDYIALMQREHYRLYQTASKQLIDPELRTFADKNLLILKRHLDAVNLIKGSMK